ncbi:lactate utilization protein [Labilibaculum sp. A4]|uniref:lactate utilization protein n=1 Tax=Labilibaculum euxinus TaxID=2686357 RepID=UPI000F619064|nr:lactate utilization protein [Labilibaculum euxinus]MDQ1773036.1 lactate utilization protein [Labilibaculum euxinus]MWN78573.1 lactate utilization protein [Labilibaculum euxinus]
MEKEKIEQLIKSLKKNRIEGIYFSSETDLINFVIDNLKPGITVGIGDSLTIEQLGLFDYLRQSSIRFLDKYQPDITKEERSQLYRDNFSADIFLSGINAITLEGKIFNLDGNGSRVAPIIYGPKRVFLVCGTNKIVQNDEEAISRIKNIAAPIDAKRLNKKTPCTKTGICLDCKSVDKICNYYTIIQGQFDKERIKVLLINGKYGF